MALIEKSKLYSGKDLENIFFHPMVSGPTANEIGIRVLYNMPMSSTIHLWKPENDLLKPFSQGWQGGSAASRSQKHIDLTRVKAEMSYDATDYFTLVFQNLVNRADINLQDLSGTELEEAETAIFKKALSESLRMTMWIGNNSFGEIYNTFDGFFAKVENAYQEVGRSYVGMDGDTINESNIAEFFSKVWNSATDELKSLKKEGQLAFFVTSDLYNLYEDYVYQNSEVTCINSTDANPTLSYRGIPVVDLGISPQMLRDNNMCECHCLLTDRRNLVLMLNTADFPEAEVRMWYNPDQMENRQRAVFLAAADCIDIDLVVYGHQ